MIENLKTNWEEFKDSEPGERFKDRYHRRREDEKGHIVRRIITIVLGFVLALGSLVLAPLPGPGFATVFLGLAIIGGELLPAARFLDWSEVALRILWQFIKDVWNTSVLGKVLVVVVAVVLAAAFLYVAYLLLFGG